MTVAEHVTCPNCRAEVLFPPSTRTVHIAVEPGLEPVVAAPGFAPWEVEAILRRAWLQYDTEGDDDEDDE